jgi:hypothetical protein
MKEGAIEWVSWPGAWQGALSAMLGYLAVFLGAGIGGALCHAVRPSLRAANAVADRAGETQTFQSEAEPNRPPPREQSP